MYSSGTDSRRGLVGLLMASAWRSACSVAAMYGPSKKRENAQPSAVSMVSAAATARSPQRIRNRQPASRVAEAPAGVIRSRTWTGSGGSGRGRSLGGRREGVRASRTAVGEPSAVRTVRRAGAGAGGTCSGMVGRLSFDRHGGARAGRGRADGAVSSRVERGGARSGEPGLAACRASRDGRVEGRAPTLCLGRGVYTTRVHAVFRLAVSRMTARHYSVGEMREIIPVPAMPHDGDLSSIRGGGRPILVGVFHESCGESELLQRRMPRECAPVTSTRVAAAGPARDVIDHIAWASSTVTRTRRPDSPVRPVEEGRFDGGEGRGGRSSTCPIGSATATSSGSA